MKLCFKERLEKALGLTFEVDYKVEDCLFDFRCDNLLIGINTSETNTSNYADDYYFKCQEVAERNGYTVIHVFDFTKDPIDIIKYYAAKLNLIPPVDYSITEIRFPVPQKHFGYSTERNTPVYDAGVYYVKHSHSERIKSLTKVNTVQDSYDVETESDRFDLSGVDSHNCRTRTLGNVYDPSHQVTTGRGNFAFTTINLPRLALEAHGSVPKFYELFDKMIDASIEELEDRFNYIAKKKAKNYPFLMQQGVYLDSDNLDAEDTIEDVIKHGSLAVGFIGLAEALIALTGHHHGEDEKSQKLGLDIVYHLRQRMDKKSEETSLTWSCFATPAEGLCERFVKLDKQLYGEIKGVTDKVYYTNSFMVPVYFKIPAFKKIQIEGPYHELCNGGSISYIEVDGDISKNILAFDNLVKLSQQCGMNYFSVNHPVDRCPVCGYTGVISDECPSCGFKEGVGVQLDKLKQRRDWPKLAKKFNFK